jgi:uncharacterized membrane protein YgcG
MKKIIIAFVFLLTVLTAKSENLLEMKPTGYVNDFQKLFTPEQKDTLERILSEYDKKTSIEFCIVTYYIEPEQYDPGVVDDLFEKWGIGKKELNNGFLMFLSYSNEKGKSNFALIPGYGLEPFLPDITLNRFKDQIFPNTLYIGNIYEAYKQYILACQNELGDDGFSMLVENQKIKEAKEKENTKRFFINALFITILLIFISGIIYLIVRIINNRKEKIKLKNDILYLINGIDDLKNQIGILPENLQLRYDEKLKNVSKKDITNENRNKMQLIYNELKAYKTTINSINSSIKDIQNSKSDIEKYLKDNYTYSEKYLKNELTNLLSFINFESIKNGEYSIERMNKLNGIKISLDQKLKSFLNKIAKINIIVKTKDNLNNKINELKANHSEYIRKKIILSGLLIGKRYDSLVNLNFDGYLSSLSSNLIDSYNLLDKNLESALSYYSNYVTTLTVIESAFDTVNSILNQYNESDKYIKLNSSKLETKLKAINSTINSSGVSYSKKSKLINIKSDITTYNNTLKSDIIESSKLLAIIIKDMEDLIISINSEISTYKSNQSYNSTYNSSSNSHSSGGGFGGFGGGSSGGGGVRGSF